MSRADEFHNAVTRHGGVNEALDHLVPNPTTVQPFPEARRLKSDMQQPQLGRRQEAIAAVLRATPVLEDVDTSTLRGTQPKVRRDALRYYLEGGDAKTGETFADKGNVGNQHPTLYRRKDRDEHDILSGHHRALAAHMQGQPLRARIVREE